MIGRQRGLLLGHELDCACRSYQSQKDHQAKRGGPTLTHASGPANPTWRCRIAWHLHHAQLANRDELGRPGFSNNAIAQPEQGMLFSLKSRRHRR
jgi:hypothetical protein